MLEIKITGSTPLEALASLTAFGLHCFSDPDVSAAANRILEAERAKGSKSDTASLAASADATVLLHDPAPDNRTALSDLSQNFTQHNSTMLSDLPPESYVEDPPHGEPAPEPKPEDQPKPPKLEEVRAKGLEAAKKYGQPAVKAILESFGVPSMTSLAEGDRAAFLEKLAELESQCVGNA